MAKSKDNNWLWIGAAALGLGAVYLLYKSKDVSGGSASTDIPVSAPFSLPVVDTSGLTFTAPTGASYSLPRDSLTPAPALQGMSAAWQQAANTLRAAAQAQGSELKASQIMPVISGLSPIEQKAAVLASSPQTLDMYARVVAGTTTVTPARRVATLDTKTVNSIVQQSAGKYIASSIKQGYVTATDARIAQAQSRQAAAAGKAPSAVTKVVQKVVKK